MNPIHIEASETINAQPPTVYAILADYHQGHPSILPKQFTQLIVKEGGVGAGTVFEAQIQAMGSKRNFVMEVTEPEPGRVLAETDRKTGTVTTFTVEPLTDGTQSRVTIATELKTSSGLAGFIERLTSPSFLRRIYQEELRLLAEAASHK